MNIEEGAAMKCLSLSVYRDAHGLDCTNGGVSAKYAEILIPCVEGPREIDEANPPENLFVLDRMTLGKAEYVRLKPYNTGGRWYMFGGNYAATSDARFAREVGHHYPVAIHDRTEDHRHG
jgi:hypothetical protein